MSDSTLRNGIEQGLWIADGDPSRARRSGYDVAPLKIFVRSSEGRTSSIFTLGLGQDFIIQPGEIIIIQSKEEIIVPSSHCAWKLPTNTLAHKGLLLLNPGLMPAGFRGSVAGTFVNFGRLEVRISAQESFLRIAFQSMDAEASETSKHIPRDELDNWMADRVLELPRSFLDLHESVPRYRAEADEAFRIAKEREIKAFTTDANAYVKGIMPWVAGAIVLFGIIQLGVNWTVHRWEEGSAESAREVGEKYANQVVEDVTKRLLAAEQFNRLQDANTKAFEKRLSDLDSQIQDLKKTPPP